MKLPQAVLFDFDGVVVNSFKAHHYGWEVAFKEIFDREICRFPTSELEGSAPIQISEYFAGFGGDITKAPELLERKYGVMALGEVVPDLLSGAKEIMAKLKSLNIPYGIASNASKHYVGQTIDILEIDVQVYTGYQDYTKPKPDPEAYLSLAKKLGVQDVKTAEVWIFEDSKTGIQAAKASGMHPYGIGTDDQVKVLKQHGADRVFAHLGAALESLFDK